MSGFSPIAAVIVANPLPTGPFSNRIAITITSRQPYLDRANSLGDDGPELIRKEE
jgi:hypothetical protein